MTIRESLTFQFNNQDSYDFGIINVYPSGGLYTETFFPTRSIIEEQIPYREKPYFFGFEYEMRDIPVTFKFLEPWNDELIKKTMHWLYTGYYKELTFSSDRSKLFYAVVNSDSNIVHAGLKDGYVEINFRCNSPFAYTNNYFTDYTVIGQRTIMIDNIGDMTVRPNIKIRKTGNGDVRIKNQSNRGKELVLKNLVDNEVIEIDGENEDIETSIEGLYRYDDFNFVFLDLIPNKNDVVITGDCYIEFNYRGKRW